MYTLRLYDITGQTVQATIADAAIQSWSKRINGPGRLIYTLPVDSPHATAAKLQKYKRIKLSRRKEDGSGDDEDVWYGYIEAHKRTNPAEFTVFCASPLELFKRRYTAKNETFTGQGSTEAFGLLSDTNSLDDTGITAGTGGVTSTKNVKATGYKDILGMWGDLAKAHGAEFDITESGLLRFVSSLGSDKTATVTLIYRTDGQPGTNVDGLEEGEDGAPLRNRIIGINSAGTLTTTQEDATSQTTYGVLQEVKVFNEAQDQNTLDSMAQDHLAQNKAPTPDFGAMPILAFKKFNVITGTRTISGFQYGDVVPGDLITCNIVSGSQSISGSKRVVEIMVEVDANGKETVQYTLGESGVFVSVTSLGGSAPAEFERRVLALEQGAGGSSSSGTSASFVDNDAYTGAINGSNAAYVISATPIAGSVYVWKNGQLMTPSVDFSVSGTTVTMTTAPLTGDSLIISFRTSSGSTSFFDPAAPTGAINDINTTFTLANTPTTGSLYVWYNGQLLTAGVDYTLSGTTITFTTAPVSGSTILVSYRY